MARNPVLTAARTLPVSVRFSADDHAWLEEVGATKGIAEVVREAVARLRRDEDEPHTPDPDAGFVQADIPITPAEFTALRIEVARMAAAVTALAGEIRSASLGTMAQQLGQTTDAMRSIAVLLGSNVPENVAPTALDNWEARRSS